jgi:proteasome lid subunit RPN8/RPN11
LRWIPAGQSSAVDPVHPIFVAGRALAAVQEKTNAPADVAASFGFLIGDVYMAPETHLPYVVVEAAIHGGWSMPGDELKAALLEARVIAEDEVKRDGGHIVGWYQTHAGADSRLSVADVEAHLACFDQPWAVALVVAGRHGLSGGVFRVESRAARWNQYLPFYELLEGESLRPGGRKVTRLAWQNYCAPGLAFPETEDARPSAPAGRVVLLDEGLDEAALEIEALRRVRSRRRSSVPARRLATVGGIGLLALGALFGTYRAVASGLPAGVAGPVPRARPSADAVDPQGDTVSYAVAAFGVRSNFFAGHKMTCQDLARGLIEVEGRWTAYIARDAAQSVTHQRLRDQVNDVEHRYTGSGCPRP